MYIYSSSSSKMSIWVVEILQTWWSRYILRPIFVSILPIFLAFYGTDPVHERVKSFSPRVTNFFDYHVLEILTCATLFIFFMTVLYGWIERKAKSSGSIADKELHTLLKVLDGVVGAKAERFGKYLRGATSTEYLAPGTVFAEITKPDEQIALLGQALYSYFESIDQDHVNLRVGVAALKNCELEDDWLYFAPQTQPPRTPLSTLRHPDSTISACIRKMDIVIVEDTQKESCKERGRNFLAASPEASDEEGSIICYPIIQPATRQVVCVLSAYANKKGYFAIKKKAIYKKVFEHFSLRIRLEDSLWQLKRRSENGGC